MEIVLRKSNRQNKKWMVDLTNPKTGKKNRVQFGARPYEDYTMHKDEARKIRYLARHRKMKEDWSKDGIITPGFWARWLLWSEPKLSSAIKLIENKFNVKIVKK